MAASFTLTPVGVGAAYGRPGEAQSAYLARSGDTVVCLDLGAGTLNRLAAHVAPEALSAIVISHLHADHCVDLLSLRIYMGYGPGRGHSLRVYGPAELPSRLAAFSGSDDWSGIEFHTLRPGVDVELGPMRLCVAEVPHTHPTYACRLDVGAASLTYGADCAPNDVLPDLASGSDLLIAECSHGAEGLPAEPIHLNAQSAADLARAAGVGALLLTHCYPGLDRDAALLVARKRFGGPVDWAVQDRQVVVSAP